MNKNKLANQVVEKIKSQVEPDDAVGAEIARKKIKILKKATSEVERLQRHAGMCLIDNNKEGFIYSIKKIRKIFNIPYSDDQLSQIYDNSRNELVQMLIKEGS